jgi:hypothetical protein
MEKEKGNENIGIRNFRGDPSGIDQEGTDSWNEAIDIALGNHQSLAMRHQQPQISVETYSSSDLFILSFESATVLQFDTIDEMFEVFKIFPWLLLSSSVIQGRKGSVKESLFTARGEDIEEVTQAINFFRIQPLHEAETNKLREYYHQMAGPPQRPLWSIVEMKRALEQEGLRSLTKGFHSLSEIPLHTLRRASVRTRRHWDPIGSF